jgi:hypothetical protein
MKTMEKIILNFLMIVAITSSFISALNIGTGAVLQVTNYTVIPSTVYPGTTGYAQITLSNTGTDIATGVTAYYNYIQSNVPIPLSEGSLSSGSTEQITIPFQIPQQVASGLYLINVGIYYSSSSTTNSIQETSISIPLVVSQQQTLQVQTIGMSKNTISSGNSFSVQVQVNNNGASNINNLIVTTPSNSSFSIQGSSQQTIGNIPLNSSINATINLTSSSTTTVGQYTIPLEFEYNNALGATVIDTLNIGPVTISGPSSNFILTMNPISPTEVGSEAVFQLTIQNIESNVESYTVNLNSTSAFTPLNQTTIYIGPINPGQSASQKIIIGISNSISAGYYTLPLQITLASGQAVNQTIGIPVTATPGFTVTTTNSGAGTITLEIANTGNTAVRSVYLSASSNSLSITGTSDEFVGTLNIDDIATLPLTISIPQNLTPNGNYSQRSGFQNMTSNKPSIQLAISFKDVNNIPYTIEKNVSITSSELTSGGATASGTTGFNRTRQTGLVFLGIGLIQWIEIIIAIVIAYLIYRYFFKKKDVKK